MTMIQARFGVVCASAGLSVLLLSGCNGAPAAGSPRNVDATSSMDATSPMNATSPMEAKAELIAEPIGKPMGARFDAGVDGRPVIACFGDSLTAGYGVDAEQSYPSNLQRDLDAGGYHYRVVNLGISGETTKDGLSRVDRVIALKPAIVVVEFGGNDGLRGLPVTASRTNLDAIVARLQGAGVKVALAGITLPPQFGGAYVQQFNQTFVLVAHKHNVPLYPFLLRDVYGVGGSIQQDGIHPTAQGCKQVARNVLGFLLPLLKKSA